MKRFSLIFTVILFSQMLTAQNNGDSYTSLWEQVQKLEREALTKSALKLVETISVKAEKEKNSAQIVKSLLFVSKYAMTLEEDAQLHIINRFKEEIDKAETPTKNVLESYLANLYWQYFQQNRYQFYNRTETETKVDSLDFRTWDLTTLFHEIDIHFKASLENEKELQKTNVKTVDELLNQQKDSEKFRPTLYDLLAHTALQFYKTNENSITRPADKYEINDPETLCEAYQFIHHDLTTDDDTSLQAKALNVYQKLITFHFDEPELEPLVMADIERLNFVYQNATFTNKETYYEETLKNSAESLKHSELSSLYNYELAKLYQNLGQTFSPEAAGETRWKLKEALSLCDAVIARFPDSMGAEKCKSLRSQIVAPSISIITERQIPVNKPSKLLVNYKNLTSLQLTAYRVNEGQAKELNRLYPQKKQLAFIKKLKEVKSWNAPVKNEKDYQQHGMEVFLPPLENGQYIILASPETKNKSDFAFSEIQVTNMALVETKGNLEQRYQIIDRNSGEPITSAHLTFSYTKNYNESYLKRTETTDRTGFVTIPLTDENWNDVTIEVDHKGEKAFFGNYYVNEKRNQTDRNTVSNRVFLFTDRSIYRPGQPVYFKGILMETIDGKSEVQPEESVSVTLYDVNGQEITELEFTTNEYGSFNGEFILPNSGLTGEFSIEADALSVNANTTQYFSVEEYKRPKFETSFKPVTETYKVNDSIKVTGVATAYAGSNITDAKVSYRVKRAVYFPRWYYWRMPYYNNSPQEIAHGETTTDASGNYNITFKAIPDSGVSKENLPTFSYEITADVTDINGETHSTTTFVSVGYHSVIANVSVPEQWDKDKNEDKIHISTSNLNGQPIPAKGTLKMYKLQAPKHVLRTRAWPAPDYKYWSQEEYNNLFPHEAYDKEDKTINWKKGKLVWQVNFDTEKSKEFSIKNLKKWASGKYIVELETKDKFGQLVKEKAITELTSENDKQLPDNRLFDIKTDKAEYSIGDKVEVTVYSNSEDLVVTVFVEKEQKIIDIRKVHLSRNSKSFSVPITEEDLGGFAINYTFSAYNSFQSGTMSISVPYPNTNLEIETSTFRDKLQPGTDETWSFKIKGPEGEKTSAELLASMYDASLDTFRPHNWSFNPFAKGSYYSTIYANAHTSYGTNSFRTYLENKDYNYTPQGYDSFNWFGLHFGYANHYRSSLTRKMSRSEAAPLGMMADDGAALEEVVITSSEAPEESEMGMSNPSPEQANPSEKDSETVQIRKNLQETAFFFPELKTDKDGTVSFSFTTPEALTKWKLQLLAHTKSLQSAVKTLQTVTQKELMVIPNAPRFLREGDEINISTKIANLTDKKLSGEAKLVLVDALSGKDISEQLFIGKGQNTFTVDALGNTQVSWRLQIPENLQAVQYTVLAKAEGFSDGEQSVLPVLTNRKLVTETLPLWVRSNQNKTFVLDKLKDNTSTTLKNHKLTLEITSNPAWYAVQALPYLMEYPYDCNEQTFSRYYANRLASHIANSNERIRAVFDQWASSDALLSNLEKNQELKSLLIQETPWLRDAQSETEQKKRIALLFDLNKMKNGEIRALDKLKNNQKYSGAWAWFNGGPDNRYITQHIVTGIGHLKQLNALPASSENQSSLKAVTEKAIAYLDAEFIEEYEQMKKFSSNLNNDHLSQMQIHYLYMRSFFKDLKTSNKIDEITEYYLGQAKKYWTNKGLYAKGMLALILNRTNEVATSKKILKSLRENSIVSEELGMYWKENTASWYWYQAPIETQALLIEAFGEIENDTETIDNLKVWLLKHKQTNQWSTTKSTAEAVYALLLQGSDWLSVSDAVNVTLGGQSIASEKLENTQVEAGTGYFKTSWNTNEIQPKMAEVRLEKKGNGIAWGALYWQYFEDLDKITSAKTPLQLKKKLFLKKNTDTGEKISEITETTNLKVGDLVRVRIELRSDRDMEFIHMKDMRAAGFEPVNVISSYKWQDGLGYYESTKDASTNFFFDHLPKGVYVFEYDVRVNNAGDFSNGITTIQSMYAPEFSSHSEGVRVEVGD
ncbi:alpha-2-macroglobulin family protein [Zobellia sp. B3R18]|uniref:alpha-2-macroglobulin family protein n=1 Tax=Zobellia sp. B3R18 TaxID=2841568 RepID=UPI001C069573|nr:MG2 domain-containing protein [Zobellia sp. B3R18]MBU2974228.1 alpha-2-macroglobulin [Zobellia sp. B3R18]